MRVAASPFPSHWLDLPDGQMHYVDELPPGEPRGTLLFVHGNPTWSFHWRRLIGAFREQWRCVAPDHLGCGLSDLQPRPLRLADHIENLSSLVKQLDLRRVTLVAQDWGGAIGLGTLLAERSRFERIVLLNTAAFRPWFCPWRIRVCRWPVVGRLAVQGGNAFSRAALTMTLARHKRLAPEVAAAYLAPYDSWQRRAAVYQFVRDIPLSPQHPTWATLGGIGSPGRIDRHAGDGHLGRAGLVLHARVPRAVRTGLAPGRVAPDRRRRALGRRGRPRGCRAADTRVS